MFKKITKEEYENLCICISYTFLTKAGRTEHGFLYKNTFYIVRLDSDGMSINVPNLERKERFSFIKEFGSFSLVSLFELLNPEEGCLAFTAPVKNEYYLATVKDDQMSVKKINAKDLE